MDRQQYSLPEINWLLSFPTEEIMKYWLEHDLLDSPGLLMHIVLGRILVFQLAKWLPKDTEFDIDTALSLTTVYHATRQSADYGKAWKHPDANVNEFMKIHGDMEYALQQAETHWLNSLVVHGIRNYIINPQFRENGYFPHETLEKNGKINWTEALPMLTSWLVAGVITHTNKRFQDLRDRRSWEIGKLELPYWYEQIRSWKFVTLPEPIVAIALKESESEYKSEQDIIEGIRNQKVTNEIMGQWILDGYEEWANHIIVEYGKLTGIQDFYGFLEDWVDTLWWEQQEKKEKIKNAFEKMIGRKLAEDEFIPYIDGIDMLFRRIEWLKVEWTRALFQEKIRRNMENIERVTQMLEKK